MIRYEGIAQSVEELVGGTPVLRLARVERELGLQGRLLAKLEGLNPAGSAKDRVGLAMIQDGEARGLIGPGAVIIEPTSGNTGIGLAACAAARGYRVILTMPDTMSLERRRLLAAFGAELVLTPGEKGMAGAIERAQELAAQIPGAFIPGQFENPANPRAHYRSTGPELYAQTGGELDCFVAGVGTGGTLTGVGRYLKERKGDIRLIAVEPAGSPVLSGGQPGPHGLQGIGAGFIPKALDASLIDQVVPVTEEDAFALCRLIARKEGVLVGISAGAAAWAAAQYLKDNPGRTAAALMPDSGERYLSSGLFSQGE